MQLLVVPHVVIATAATYSARIEVPQHVIMHGWSLF